MPFVLDCIGSKAGSLAPIARIAKTGTKVAVLLPVIVRDASEAETPLYEMDVEAAAEWEEGVDARGVRTHFYLEVMYCILGFKVQVLILDRMSSLRSICSRLLCRYCWLREL